MCINTDKSKDYILLGMLYNNSDKKSSKFVSWDQPISNFTEKKPQQEQIDWKSLSNIHDLLLDQTLKLLLITEQTKTWSNNSTRYYIYNWVTIG